MNEVIIKETETILEALKKLEENKKRFLCCIDIQKKLTSVLTDGDIRRGFLKGCTVEDSIEKIKSSDFKYIYEDSSFDQVCELFKSDKIDFLPIVDSNMKLFNILTKKQFNTMLLENIPFDLGYNFKQLDAFSIEHAIYNRPWGFYKSTILTSHAQSKIITIFPGEELSLQEHKRREEHWVIIKGHGKVVLGESTLDVSPGKYISIPKGCKHQMINNSSENIIFSEVQLGDYFGEDDIIRYSDKYGRARRINNEF